MVARSDSADLSPRPATDETPSHGQLLSTSIRLIWFAINRVVNYRDLPYVSLVLIAPLLHLMRFKGELKTPVGKLSIQRNDVLRWSIYGLFKTKFCYMRMLESPRFRNSPRLIVLDVGANLGDFTMAIAKRAKKIISLEPGRNNFVLLCSNLRANSLTQVIPLNIAAHDSTEKLSLDGIAADLRVTKFNGGEPTIGLPLDDVLRTHEVGYLDIAKIDVQGHEAAALRGMSSYMRARRVGLIIVEIHPNRNIKAADIVKLLKPFGYELTTTDYLFGRPQLYFETAQ